MMDYKSPIEITYGQFRLEQEKRIEGEVFKAIQDYGINIDKDELIKALQYDRDQYRKGFEDGYRDGISPIAPKTNFDIIKGMTITELAEFMCRHTDCSRCVGEDFCRFGEDTGNGIIKYLEKEGDN